MKKGKKLLVLSTLLGIAIGTGGIIEYHDATQRIQDKDVMAYKIDANNILDNVYTQNGQRILPIIFKSADESVSRNKIINDFKAKGLTLKGNLPEIITTGVKLVTTNNETYNVVVFGDVDDSGEIDISDAHAILKHCIDDNLTGNYQIAANVHNDTDEIDISDAHRILMFCIESTDKLVLNAPVSDAENNVVTKIEMITQPTKKTYNYGENIDVSGGKIKITRASGKTESIDIKNNMVSGYNPKKVGEQTVTVTYEGKKITFKVNVIDPVTKIEMVVLPTKTTYNYGEDINVNGGKIKVIKASGITTIDMTRDMIKKYDSKVLGYQDVTVAYKGVTTTFKVNVKDVVTGIEIEALPTKLEYSLGDDIDVSGGKVKVIYASGKIDSKNMVESMITKYDSSKLGEQNVTVTYEGKTAIFKVNIKDTVTKIEMDTLPTKTTYNYGENINVNGGKIKVIKASGTKIVDITETMIVKYDSKILGFQNVVVEYGGKTTTFRVEVKDVITGIKIETLPTKLEYVVGEKIDVTGGKIKVINASGTLTQPIDLTEDMITKYDSTKLGEQDVIVTYEGKTATFKVTVTEPKEDEYITKFEITKEPSKLEYIVGENISVAGMVIKVTKSDGTQTELDLSNITISTNINDPYTSNTEVFADSRIITVSYKGKNEAGELTTFEDTFEITVVKPVENITVITGTTTGYMYDTLTSVATVESGEGELDITVNNLDWIVKDSKGNVIKDSKGTVINNEIEVTLEAVQFTKKVAINFRALREGIYTIIPKVGETEGQAIQITIDANNPIVTRIELGAISDENKFRIGQTRDINVEFIHEYETNVERTIQVEARRMSLEINGKVAVEGTDYNLLDSTGRIINSVTNPNETVSKIRLIGATIGEKVINIYVDKGQSEKEAKVTRNVTILAEAKVFVKIAEESKSIKLYTTMPTMLADDEIIEQYNGSIYTLARIWLEDEDGNITKITQNNITSFKNDTSKVQLIDSKYDAGTLPMSLVTYRLYKGTKGNITATEPAEGADYIGIAIVNNAAERLRNERIIVRYGESSEEINIDIPRSDISTITVTKGTSVGYCNQLIQVGTVKSGMNEMPITVDNLEWEVQDAQGNVIKNSQGTVNNSYINIQLTQPQMTETVAIEFSSQEKGTYKIIPKVGEVSGNAIEVTIEDNPIVTRIGLGDIEGTLRVGKRKELNIEFFHEYAVNDERQIQVEANRVTVEINGTLAVAGTDYELMEYDEINKVNKIINVENDPVAKVHKIQLIGTNAGEKVINIYVDKNTENEEITTKTITVEEPAVATLTTDAETIKLYSTMPENVGDDEKVELGTDGKTPYTLIKVWLDADGEVTNITRADLTNNTVQVKFDFQGTMQMPLNLEAYKEEIIDGQKVISRAEGEEPVTYLGIAMFAGGDSVIKNGDNIMLQYNGTTVKELTVNK